MTQNSPETPQGPAKNAIRHGLTSTTHVPDKRMEQVEIIRSELTRIHEPQTAEERDCIHELALVRWKTFENERLHQLRIKTEAAMAGDIFDRQMVDRFEADEALWKANPRFRMDLLGRTLHGAALFVQLWTEIQSALNSKVQRMTLPQAKTMALLLGSSWKVQDLSDNALPLLGRYLKLEADPPETLKMWVEASGSDAIAGDIKLIKHHYQSSPEKIVCHKELLTRVSTEVQNWTSRKRNLEMEYATQRTRFIEMAAGTGLGDPKLTTDARLALRYQITTENRADKLVRRLDGLKRHRALLEHRQAAAAEREARRQAKLEQSIVVMPTEEQIEADFEGTLNELNALLESARNIAANAVKPAESENAQTQPTQEDAAQVRNNKSNASEESQAEFSDKFQRRLERFLKGKTKAQRARIMKQAREKQAEMRLARAV